MNTANAFVTHVEKLLENPALRPRLVPLLANEWATTRLADAVRKLDAAPALANVNPEADAFEAWLCAAGGDHNGLPLLPFFITYSGAGRHRIGDVIRSAAEAKAVGFLVHVVPDRAQVELGTLPGHDGTGHLVAASLARCRAFDPSSAQELGEILRYGTKRLSTGQANEFYYITVQETDAGIAPITSEGNTNVLRGMHCVRTGAPGSRRVQLMGSGAALTEVMNAAARLEAEQRIAADVWSVTSYTELAREARQQERAWYRGERATTDSWIEQTLRPTCGPILAVTDHLRTLPEFVRAFIPSGRLYVTLGEDIFDSVTPSHGPASKPGTSADDIFEMALRVVRIAEFEESLPAGKSHLELMATACI